MRIHDIEQYIETGNFHDLDLMLTQDPSILNRPTSQAISPLLLACYYHKDQVIKTILKHLTAITIHEACAVGLAQDVEKMLAQKPQIINEYASHGFTPLGIAAHFGKEEVLRILLRHRADPNLFSQNGHHVYPLHASLTAKFNTISKMLVEAGAQVNAVQKDQITPLHLAAQQGNIDMIILLLENGADIHSKTSMGLSAADLALEKGFKEIATILKIT